MLTKLKHFVPENILHSLYCTLILPYINYGVLIWGNTCKTYLDKIFKVQKWAIRTISNSHYTGCPRMFYTQKWKILRIFITIKTIEFGNLIYLGDRAVLFAFWRILNQGNRPNKTENT